MLVHTMMVAHVAKAVQMHHKRDSGDNHQHHRRDGIEQKSETDYKLIGELEPCLVENKVLQTLAGSIDEFGSAAEEIYVCGIIGKQQDCSHAEATEHARKFVAHLHAQQTEQKEHEQRDAQNQ